MGHFIFDSQAYLKRLRLAEEILPNLEGLRALQKAQLFNIPVENFDIQLNRSINLDPEHLFEKMIRRPRGGYCFELNGLFLMALHAFGFKARPLLGRVHLTGTPSGRGHQISLVELDGLKWIADAGFGRDTPLGPLRLKHDMIHDFRGQAFRLIDGNEFGTMLQRREGNEWKNLYSFDMEHVCQADISYGNHYTSTSPHSFFTTSRFAVRPIEDGWNVLFNHRLKLIRNDQVETMEIPGGNKYLDALKTYFGIDLDAPYEALKTIVEKQPAP